MKKKLYFDEVCFNKCLEEGKKIIEKMNDYNNHSLYKINRDDMIKILKGNIKLSEKVFEDIVMKELCNRMGIFYNPDWRI